MSLKTERDKKKITNKARKEFNGQPVATIAYYGPTDKDATKVAASIIAQENADPEPIKSWFSDADVGNNTLMMEELLAFIAEHNTKSVIMTDGIIGYTISAFIIRRDLIFFLNSITCEKHIGATVG
jgi:hypothetical protein